MNLNNIPQEKTEDFPMGVSEAIYPTKAQCDAFTDGLNFADDGDVSHGDSFQRGNDFVVRVQVGDWSEDDDETEDDGDDS